MKHLKTLWAKVSIKTCLVLRNRRYNKQLTQIMMQRDFQDVPLKHIFGGTSDDFWLWAYTEGYRQHVALRQCLPKMPDEQIQRQFTGASGDQTLQLAFSAYILFKKLAAQYGTPLDQCENMLEFGCGWGRILRFFLKDFMSENLYGSDCDADVLEICRNSNFQSPFILNEPYPPVEFDDNMFDFIYSYSVFSHLAEDIHKAWLAEISRILRPGGVFIATTRPKQFIFHCAELRKQAEIPSHASGAANAFFDTEQHLRAYDNGEFCFSGTGGGGIRTDSFYGETCIPSTYVTRVWTKYFSKVDFIHQKDHQRFDQSIIITRK